MPVDLKEKLKDRKEAKYCLPLHNWRKYNNKTTVLIYKEAQDALLKKL
jgi:hypothetical protein